MMETDSEESLERIATLRINPVVANPIPHPIDSLPPNTAVSLAIAACSTRLDDAEIPPLLYSDRPRYPTVP